MLIQRVAWPVGWCGIEIGHVGSGRVRLLGWVVVVVALLRSVIIIELIKRGGSRRRRLIVALIARFVLVSAALVGTPRRRSTIRRVSLLRGAAHALRGGRPWRWWHTPSGLSVIRCGFRPWWRASLLPHRIHSRHGHRPARRPEAFVSVVHGRTVALVGRGAPPGLRITLLRVPSLRGAPWPVTVARRTHRATRRALPSVIARRGPHPIPGDVHAAHLLHYDVLLVSIRPPLLAREGRERATAEAGILGAHRLSTHSSPSSTAIHYYVVSIRRLGGKEDQASASWD